MHRLRPAHERACIVSHAFRPTPATLVQKHPCSQARMHRQPCIQANTSYIGADTPLPARVHICAPAQAQTAAQACSRKRSPASMSLAVGLCSCPKARCAGHAQRQGAMKSLQPVGQDGQCDEVQVCANSLACFFMIAGQARTLCVGSGALICWLTREQLLVDVTPATENFKWIMWKFD